MLKELIDRVVELGVQASTARVLPCDREPSHIYWLEGSDGKLTRIEAEPVPRKSRASDLSAIVGFALDHHVPPQTVEIWYSRTSVVVYLDSLTRRDLVQLTLTISSQIKLLAELEANRRALDQKQFVNLLRINLNRCVTPTLLQSVRLVKFRQEANSGGEIQHGKASIGKSLEAELRGAQTVPEEVTVCVPVFEGFLAHRTFEVECAVDIDAAAERFSLIPYPGSVEGAIRAAEAAIGNQLLEMLGSAWVPPEDEPEAELDIPVLYGSP